MNSQRNCRTDEEPENEPARDESESLWAARESFWLYEVRRGYSIHLIARNEAWTERDPTRSQSGSSQGRAIPYQGTRDPGNPAKARIGKTFACAITPQGVSPADPTAAPAVSDRGVHAPVDLRASRPTATRVVVLLHGVLPVRDGRTSRTRAGPAYRSKTRARTEATPTKDA